MSEKSKNAVIYPVMAESVVKKKKKEKKSCSVMQVCIKVKSLQKQAVADAAVKVSGWLLAQPNKLKLALLLPGHQKK